MKVEFEHIDADGSPTLAMWGENEFDNGFIRAFLSKFLDKGYVFYPEEVMHDVEGDFRIGLRLICAPRED